jgi:signal transduction histidine kinase
MNLPAALANGKEMTVVRRDPHGDRRYTYVPMTPAGRRPAVLELSERASPPHAFIRASIIENVLSTMLIISICSLVALSLGFWLIGRPMRLLIAKARRVGAGDFSGPLQLRQRDEIGALAAEIDLTSDHLAEAQSRVATETEARITALEQLRHADRLKTIGQLASGVAHELGTPLNVISGRASIIASDTTHADTATAARIIIEQTERMTRIIRHLLDFSRRRGPQLARGELDRLVANAVDILAPLAKAHHVTIAVDAHEPAPAEIDQNQMLQALTNLMVNGMQAMPNGGRLTVTVGHRRARPPADHGGEEADYVCVSVADEGEGMSRETLAHAFEPFFTTKDVGEGTGLGLSVAWGIVQEHGGWIDVASELGGGSEFAILLRSAPA